MTDNKKVCMTTMGSNHMNEHFRRKDPKYQYAKYAKSPYEFINNHRLVLDFKEGKYLNKPLFNFEYEFLKHIHENNYSITKKTRQMHTTTLTAAYCAWRLIFKNDYNIKLFSNNKETSARFIENVKRNIQNYSNDLFNWENDVITDNKYEISLKNGSTIRGVGNSKTALRGYRPDLIILDEAAFIKGVDKIWVEACMALCANGKCIIYSSPQDKKGFFYKAWNKSVENKNDFKSMNIHWSVNPRFNSGMTLENGNQTSPWYEDFCKTLNYDEFSIKTELDGVFFEKKKKSHRINLRLESEIYLKMEEERLGDSNVSNYIKGLIKKDLGL